MMKIYRYNHNNPEYRKVVNNPTLKGEKRNEAIDEAIHILGEEISIREYFNDHKRNYLLRDDDISYAIFGKPENTIERLAYAEIEYDNDLSYCDAKMHSPEDLIEARTSWDEMESYADGLYYFIESLKSEIACGKIVTPQPHWKPSEGQMEILQYVCEESSHPNQDVIPTLQSLYNDLQKLM